MNKSSGNKVHFNTAGLTTEESGGLSRLGSIVLPASWLQAASGGGESETITGKGFVGAGSGARVLGDSFKLAFPEERVRGTLCTKSQSLRALLISECV